MEEEISTPGEGGEAQEEIDYAARAQELEAQVAELTKTNRSQEIRISKHQSSDKAIANLEKRIIESERKHVLEMARLRAASGVEPEPETEYDRLKRQFEEEDKAKPQPKPEFSDEEYEAASDARAICKLNKWGESSAQWKKALTMNPIDGLAYLQEEAEKVVEAKAKERAELLHKQAIKDAGGTGEGGGPSAASTDRAELRRLYIENPNNPRAAEWEAIRRQR